MTTARLQGASTWEEGLFEAFQSHAEQEHQLLDTYRALADDLSSPDVSFLVRLILEDEERHHRLFEELAGTLRAQIELEPEPTTIPDVPLHRKDPSALIDVTDHLLALEREDSKKLRELRKQLRPVEETTVWSLIIETMELDTKKHIALLKHIRKLAKGID
jgi:rubrerythrin